MNKKWALEPRHLMIRKSDKRQGQNRGERASCQRPTSSQRHHPWPRSTDPRNVSTPGLTNSNLLSKAAFPATLQILRWPPNNFRLIILVFFSFRITGDTCFVCSFLSVFITIISPLYQTRCIDNIQQISVRLNVKERWLEHVHSQVWPIFHWTDKRDIWTIYLQQKRPNIRWEHSHL